VLWVEQVLLLVYKIQTYIIKKKLITEKRQFNSKVTNLLGEGVLLLGILFEHFSVGVDIGLGSILDSKFFGFSTN